MLFGGDDSLSRRPVACAEETVVEDRHRKSGPRERPGELVEAWLLYA